MQTLQLLGMLYVLAMYSQTTLCWYLGNDSVWVLFFAFIQSEMTLGKFLVLIWQLLSVEDQQTYVRSSRA